MTAFNGLMVMISNSSLTETRGTVNGYGQALCAIGRGLGPVVGATAFAWSENTGIDIILTTAFLSLFPSGVLPLLLLTIRTLLFAGTKLAICPIFANICACEY